MMNLKERKLSAKLFALTKIVMTAPLKIDERF